MKPLVTAPLAAAVSLAAVGSARADAPTPPRLDLRVASADAGAPSTAPAATSATQASVQARAPSPPPVRLKRPGTARALALALPVAGVAVAVGGIAVAAVSENDPTLFASGFLVGSGLALLAAGPSSGHFYAGEWKHGALFTGLRAVTGIVGAVALSVGALYEGCYDDCPPPEVVVPIGLGSMAVSIGLAAYDIWDSARAARRFNARARVEAGLTASVVPTYDPQRRAGGLALAGRF